MKKILMISSLLIFLTRPCHAQSAPGFSRVYRDSLIASPNDFRMASVTTLLYDSTQQALYFSMSIQFGPDRSYTRFYKTDVDGTEQATIYDTAGLYSISYAASTTDGSYIYWTGTKVHYWDQGLSRQKVVKTDMNLNIIWEKEYDPGNNANGSYAKKQQILLLRDGNLLLSAAQLYKIDSAGTILDSNVNFTGDHTILGMVATDDGGCIVSNRFEITALDSHLQPQWSEARATYEGGGMITRSKEHEHVFYISGGTYENGPGMIDAGYMNGNIQKITDDGSTNQAETYTKYTRASSVYTLLDDGYQSVCNAPGNGCAAVGSAQIPNLIFGEINRVDSNLHSIWNHGYTHPAGNFSRLSRIISLPDGSFVAAGWAMAPNPEQVMEQQGWLLRVDSNGCYNSSCTGFIEPEPIGIAKIPENQLRVFPNPANDVLRIELQQPSSSGTHIYITDISGRPVQQAVIARGATELTMEVRHLTSGLYLMAVYHDGKRYYDKIVLQH